MNTSPTNTPTPPTASWQGYTVPCGVSQYAYVTFDQWGAAFVTYVQVPIMRWQL